MIEEDLKVLRELAKENEMLASVVKHLESLSREDNLLTDYEIELMDRLERNSIIRDAERTGHEQGIEQGFEKGREEGREEEKQETAKSLLQQGILSINQIKEVTGISKGELEQLKKEIS